MAFDQRDECEGALAMLRIRDADEGRLSDAGHLVQCLLDIARNHSTPSVSISSERRPRIVMKPSRSIIPRSPVLSHPVPIVSAVLSGRPQ